MDKVKLHKKIGRETIKQPANKVYRDKKRYTRKRKHKNCAYDPL